MKIRTGVELFQAYWWTDTTKLIVAFRSFANAPKNVGRTKETEIRRKKVMEKMEKFMHLCWFV
jgi:hypothetical protein